jgi:hypothetical protein
VNYIQDIRGNTREAADFEKNLTLEILNENINFSAQDVVFAPVFARGDNKFIRLRKLMVLKLNLKIILFLKRI